MGRSSQMRQVEIVDLVEAAPEPERTPHRARRWLVAAAVVAVGAVLLGGQSVLDARERAEIAALANIPGVVLPVDEHLTVVRRVSSDDGSWLFGWGSSVIDAPDGSQSYAWSDPSTGAKRWTASLLGPTPARASDDGTQGQVIGYSMCQPNGKRLGDVSDATRVACLVTDGAFVVDDTGIATRRAATTTRLVVLDVADGSVVSDWPVDPAESLTLAPGLIVTAALTDGGAVVRAYNAGTGARRWTYELPQNPVNVSSDAWQGVSVSLVGRWIALQSPENRVAILSADGRLVRDLVPPTGGYYGWAVDQSTGRLMFSTDGGPTATVTLMAEDADPTKDRELSGALVSIGVDDGSLPGLALTVDTQLHAWDAATGAARWSTSGSKPLFVDQAMVMRGRVFVTAGNTVSAFDGRTGKVLWTVETKPGLYVTGFFTDGRNILVPLNGSDDGTQAVLAAYDASSGRLAFEASYPDGVDQVSPGANHRLVGFDNGAGGYAILG